jgi:hypothetical protein
MLYALFELGKTLALGFLVNDYFRKNYPNKHREIGLEIIFNILYTYSYCQVLCKNGVKYITDINPKLVKIIQELIKNKAKQPKVEFIKDNKVICENSKDFYLTTKEVSIIPDYDFILYTDTSTSPSNIKIIHKNAKEFSIINEETYNYEVSTIRFMLIELIVGDKNYKIDLATDKYNFYVKGNILDKKFFLYYLHYIHLDTIIFEEENIDNINFVLKILDHNIDNKRVEFTNDDTQCIHF